MGPDTSGNVVSVSHTPLTPLSFLERAARAHADREAVVYGSTRLTYAEFAAQTIRMASALRASGIQAGDRVALCMPNLPEMLMAHFAVPLLQAVLVPINTRLSPNEIAHILAHSKCSLVIVDSALANGVIKAAERVQTCRDVVVFTDGEARHHPEPSSNDPQGNADSSGSAAAIPQQTSGVERDDLEKGKHEPLGDPRKSAEETGLAPDSQSDRTSSAASASTQKVTPYEDFLGRAGEPEHAQKTSFDDFAAIDDEDAPISINYTSGTTGKPKGVVYTHRGAHLNSLAEVIHSRHTTESRYLWTLPMFHCNGWCTTWAVTAIAGTHICLREVRGEAIWHAIDSEEITHLNGAPTVLTTIASDEHAHDLERPIIVTTAGAPPAPATISRMESKGFEIIHVYGLTETYGPYAIREARPEWRELPVAERAALQAQQGFSMVHAEHMRVVDPDMNDVPADGQTMGEVVMHGNGVMAGYLDDESGTEQAFRGGWFHSGDLGVMHPDGTIQLRDRAKDVVVSGGENISTIEVEQALMSHDDVVEVAVIGVPDEKWGERPKAFVVIRDGASLTPEALITHVRENIARYKAPRDVEIVPTLPKTSTGKIQKFELRNKEWGDGAERIRG